MQLHPICRCLYIGLHLAIVNSIKQIPCSLNKLVMLFCHLLIQLQPSLINKGPDQR